MHKNTNLSLTLGKLLGFALFSNRFIHTSTSVPREPSYHRNFHEQDNLPGCLTSLNKTRHKHNVHIILILHNSEFLENHDSFIKSQSC